MSRALLGSLTVFAITVAVALGPKPTLAGWSAEPVEVHATTNECPLVAACEDGAHGAIVVWQEIVSGTAGVLRARRLLPSGDVDPSWPSPAEPCSATAARSMLTVIADGLGGAYVIWIERYALYLSRIGADGVLAPGWSERGRLLHAYTVVPPRAISDGSHGLYVTWLALRQQYVWTGSTYEVVEAWCHVVLHVGPENSGAGGWGELSKIIGTAGTNSVHPVETAIGLAPDGGLWLVWSTMHAAPGASVVTSGSWWLTRITPSGSAWGGFDGQGAWLGPFPGDDAAEQFGHAVGRGFDTNHTWCGVVSDGADGAYVLITRPASPPSGLLVQPILMHVDAESLPLPGWPRDVGEGPQSVATAGVATPSVSLATLRPGEVAVGAPILGDGSTVRYRFVAHSDLAPPRLLAETHDRGLAMLEYVVPRPGHLFMASGLPEGLPESWPLGAQPAFVNVAGTLGGAGFRDTAPGWPQHRYGDIALSATPDGGAIFAWSQFVDRHGIYAVRLNAAGLVTDAPPAASPRAPHLALRFEPGAGIRARASFAGAGETRLLLADVTGRAVARETFEAAEGGREWTLAGTAALAPGLYFARVTRGAETLTARVVVTR